MKQYELRWVNLAQPAGRRPALLLSRSAAYEYLHHIVIAEVTSRVRGIPQEVRLGRPEGLSRSSVANLDRIRLVPRDSIGDRIGTIGPGRQIEVKRALGYALDWVELKQI
jgi:mRNA-degrading endonuclease toxin of MazEF toxin-antitoxin module